MAAEHRLSGKSFQQLAPARHSAGGSHRGLVSGKGPLRLPERMKQMPRQQHPG